MSVFEGASEFSIHGGQFNQVTGNILYQLGPHDDSDQIVRRLVEKDSCLNQYSVEHGTVNIPHFSKSLLLQDLQIDPDFSRMNAGSCSFDLLRRLGLLPGQTNEALAEYDTKVPLDVVVCRGNCYCGRISRHGFVFLASKYFQHVSVAETTTGGTCFILSTTIGRFKCYEIDDRTFIHFDSGTRSSYVEIIKDQNLEDILRTARGEYQHFVGPFLGTTAKANNPFEWRRMEAHESLERLACTQFYGVTNAVIYMTRSTLQRWKRIKDFAYAMLETVLSVLDGVEEPAEFVSALRKLPPLNDGAQSYKVSMRTPVEKLTSSIFLYRALSGQRIGAKSYEDIGNIFSKVLNDMLEAHKYLRSPKVEMTKLIDTSLVRFLQILDGFPSVGELNGAKHGKKHIQEELLAVLQTKKNNVALVAMQGIYAVLSQWNASRVLFKAREAPEEWIRFVGADDDELFIG